MGRERQRAKSQAARDKALDAALSLFSEQGYRATSMRQIADGAGISMGNVYYHFDSKEAIFETLLDRFWDRVLDPELRLNKVFEARAFPDDISGLADAIRDLVEENPSEMLLIYVDVIEFRGEHIHKFYVEMTRRYREYYGEALARKQADGEIGEVDPVFAVTLTIRFLVYYFTVERCFGLPDHMGMPTPQAIEELSRLLHRGLDPRS